MIPTNPTTYTDVSKENYESFKQNAKTHGMNISGNSDNVEFDKIPVHIEYTPDEKKLQFNISEPHWLAPGVTAAALHRLVAAAVDTNAVPQANENPQVTHQHDVKEKTTSAHERDAEKVGPHPAHPSTHATATHSHGK